MPVKLWDVVDYQAGGLAHTVMKGATTREVLNYLRRPGRMMADNDGISIHRAIPKEYDADEFMREFGRRQQQNDCDP